MPDLTIIAGCNGAGKSTFAETFLLLDIHSFDYDKKLSENYNSLPDSELREVFAKNTTNKEFEQAIGDSIRLKKDFCYETNFDVYPIDWAKVFKENGFTLNLIFFCLDNQEIARHRVQVRTEFKGHFIDNETINLKWKVGYKNIRAPLLIPLGNKMELLEVPINKHFGFFDNLLLVDNSITNEIYSNILQIKNGVVEVMTSKLPDYFIRRFPDIYKMIDKI